MNLPQPPDDQATAAAFASSWNTVRAGSVYTREQFLDWISPLEAHDLEGSSVLELGYGNGSLLFHAANCLPARLVGLELGDTALTAQKNLENAAVKPELRAGDLCQVEVGQFDVVYCIGVLHHLSDPEAGFVGVLRNTRPGGRFHCWVYGYEGNELVRRFVEPVRSIASGLPWWFTKYFLAAPLVTPYFVYAKALKALISWFPSSTLFLTKLPLFEYTRWISARPFWFFHHVAFDQLVTPQTQYLSEGYARKLLAHPQVDPTSSYVIRRNGNSWKFGGRKVERTV